MKGRFPVSKTGVSEDEFENAGDTGGAKTHQLTVGELAAHTHSYMAASLVAPTVLYYEPGSSMENIPNYYPYLDNTGSTGGNEEHNTLPPYIVLPIAQIKT